MNEDSIMLRNRSRKNVAKIHARVNQTHDAKRGNHKERTRRNVARNAKRYAFDA